MMKFTVKSLITLFVTGSALLLTPLSSYAQVNMKILTPVAKSCQRDAPLNDYYKRMGVNIDDPQTHDFLTSSDYKNDLIQECIRRRYHYSLVLSKLPWLASTGEMLPGYPGSVAVGNMAYTIFDSPLSLLDCIASQNTSSQECKTVPFYPIAPGTKIRELFSFSSTSNFTYNFYVCPSCIVSHDNIVSKEAIVTAFIQWFLRLEKPKRRELMSILGDDEALELRRKMYSETNAAVYEYREARKRVEQQRRERRRQELLGQ